MGRGMSSMMWLLCLLLSMDMTLAQSNKIPYFGLFISPDLYYPSMDKFCMHSSQDLEGFSQISVDMNTTLESINMYIIYPDSPQWICQPFPVPEPAGPTETATIVVQGTDIGGRRIEITSTEVTLRKKNTGTFIQADKAVYKPGQNVMIRMVTLDQDMEVLNKTYSLVELRDPQKNRLAQWKNVQAQSGIAELSYPLSPEAKPGSYNIKSDDASLVITVDEYSLPSFGVFINAPNFISLSDIKLSIAVSARYTHGEKVTGDATLKVCQKRRPRYFFWGRTQEKDDKNSDLCFTQNAKTDSSGELKSEVDLSQFSLQHTDYSRELEVEASMEEEGTDVKMSAPKKTISIKNELTKLTFKDTKGYYQPGVPYRGKLVLESYDGKRLPDKKVNLNVDVNGNDHKEMYMTDSAGEVSFQLSTSKWGKGRVSLHATTDDKNDPYIRDKVPIRHAGAYLSLDGIHVTTESSVYIHPVKSSAQCHENVMVTVDYTIKEQEGDNIDFFYLAVVKNRLSIGGEKKVKKKDSHTGTFQFPMKIGDISPLAKLLVFTVSKTGGVAADTTEVKVPDCLKHKVSLRFSEAEALPGSDVLLHLQANGGSMCAVRAVDKSVVMMKPEAEMTQSKLQNLVQAKRTYIRAQRLDYNYCRDKETKRTVNTDDSDSSDNWGWGSNPVKKKDLQNIIQDMGLHILSTWDIVAPTTCKPHRTHVKLLNTNARAPAPGRTAMRGAPVMMMAPAESMSHEDDGDDNQDGGSSKTRIFFPETWLWQLKEVPKSGSAEIRASVPDTITEWSAQMFCVGPGGLGVSSPVPLKAFKPFFMDLKLPYSVKRGESFPLKVSVFNYMPDPMKINVSLQPSNEFRTIKSVRTEDNKVSEKSFCLPGGVKRTVSWDVTPTIIGQMNITVIAEAVKSKELCGEQETVIPKKGRRDIVIQSVLVVPEGTVVEQTHNSLLICDGNSVSEKVKFEFPSSYVPGSEKMFISVCGDIMGPSLSNIGNLLAMSSGCGEQNMVRFAPNIYILNYLNMSHQLNPTVLAKGKEMLEKGYARQLMYKHEDGSYSAFGKNDNEGNTWLTAFVAKSLRQACSFISIDENTQNQSMKWLKNQQKPNGCFKATGRLLHNGMKGGVDDEISLTAYVISALLEAGTPSNDPTVQRALECIRSEPLEKATLYKMALKGYAFTLANDEESRATVLQTLEQQATKIDDLLYWTQEAKSNSDSYWSNPVSVDVEITAYVMSIYASGNDLGRMASMGRWLSKQQNANGGFSSTQDTVMGLQALSKYASRTFSKMGVMTIDMTSENGFRHRFQVDNDNRLLLQKMQLPKIPGEYTVTVSGTGSVIMQAVQRHNVLPDAKKDAFVMTAKPQCVNSDLLTVSVEFWYTGNRNSTNMVILKAGLLSGYEIDSLGKLKELPMVKRVESDKDSVSFYVEQVTAKKQTLEFQAKKIVPVSGLKPAIIQMFDYYMPEEETTVSYLMNC